VLGLRWFRDRAAIGSLGRDHGISRATAYRYVDEVIAVLAAAAPELPGALARAMAQGVAFVVPDGKIIASGRCKGKTLSVQGEAIDVWYSGKAHHHGGNVQAVARPDGFPLWICPAEPGSVHDITAARIHALPALCRAAALGLPTLAGPGYADAGIGIHIPVRQPEDGREPDAGNRTRNAIQRSLRCLGERMFALLTQRWRTLQHITASPSNHRNRPRRPRPHPLRTRLPQMSEPAFAEITSMPMSITRGRSAIAVFSSRESLAGKRCFSGALVSGGDRPAARHRAIDDQRPPDWVQPSRAGDRRQRPI
jgi:hypothetical protein